MQPGQPSVKIFKNRPLLIAFICLIIMIVALVVSLILLNNSQTPESQEETEITVDIPDQVDGYNGPISAATQALIFSQNIQDKLSADTNYTQEQATAEYEAAFKQSSGDLKLYLAIEYANYLYQLNSDLEQAITILQDITYTDGTQAELDYLNALYNLYDKAGDIGKAGEYDQIIKEQMPEIKNAYSGEEGQ